MIIGGFCVVLILLLKPFLLLFLGYFAPFWCNFVSIL
nr:MAG TPA: hypothetical protein [Caudoviricetes sp.]